MEGARNFGGYEQREVFGKMKVERKSPNSAAKGVEKKISCLLKKISKLENQRGNCHENLFKVKKKINNQTNQIIKCFRERERGLLCEADEAFSAQISSINGELAKLIATHASCHTLFANIQDLNGNVDVLSKINEYLSTVNLEEKTLKPLKFTSNLELAKTDATNYGCLEGDFVRQNIPVQFKENVAGQKIEREENIQSSPCNYCHLNALELGEVPKTMTRRERTDSQDSFEIVDILDNNYCLEDKSFLKSDENHYPEDVAEIAVPCKENLVMFPKKVEPPASAKYSAFEKQLSELQNRLKNLNTSASNPNLSPKNVINPEHTSKAKNDRIFTLLNDDREGWLHKSPMLTDKELIDQGAKAISFQSKSSESPAHLIRKAFSSYFGNENLENWLSK